MATDQLINKTQGDAIIAGLTAIKNAINDQPVPTQVEDVVADAFDVGVSYVPGDYCIYENKLYKCDTAHHGAWDGNDFTLTTVAAELDSVNNALNDITLFTTFSTVTTWTDFSVDLTQYKTLWILPYRVSDNAKASPKSIPIKALIDMAPTKIAPFNLVWLPINAGNPGGTPYSGQLCVNVAISGTNTLELWTYNWPIRVYLSKT